MVSVSPSPLLAAGSINLQLARVLTLVPPGVSVKRLEDSVDQALSQVKEREKCHDALKQLDLELEGVVSTDETAAVAMEALRGAIHGAQRLHLAHDTPELLRCRKHLQARRSHGHRSTE